MLEYVILKPLLVYINFKKYGPGISVVKTRNMSDRLPRKLMVNVCYSFLPEIKVYN